jgi:hypothetical protein
MVSAKAIRTHRTPLLSSVPITRLLPLSSLGGDVDEEQVSYF